MIDWEQLEILEEMIKHFNGHKATKPVLLSEVMKYLKQRLMVYGTISQLIYNQNILEPEVQDSSLGNWEQGKCIKNLKMYNLIKKVLVKRSVPGPGLKPKLYLDIKILSEVIFELRIRNITLL